MKKCLTCGKQFVVYQNHGKYVDMYATAKRMFCNHTCVRASDEQKRNMSLAQRGHSRGGWSIKSDAKSRIKGKKLSMETRLKLSATHKGEKHWNWKGGITPINKHRTGTTEYKEWRKAVFERDEYTCTECGIKGNQTGGYLEADHIKPWAYYQELRYELTNGRTLCKPCHKKTDTYMGRAKKFQLI